MWTVSLALVDGESVTGYFAAPEHGGEGTRRPAALVLQNHGGGAWPVPPEWAADLAGLGFIAFAMQTHDCENGREEGYYNGLNAGQVAMAIGCILMSFFGESLSIGSVNRIEAGPG